MILVNPNEVKPFEVKNRKIKGFSVSAFLTCGTAGVDTYSKSLDIDFSKVLFKAILKRDEQSFTIIQEDMKLLGLSSNLNQFPVRAFYQDHAYGHIITEATASVKGQTTLGFDIDLGGTIDCQGTDVLYCEVNVAPGAFSAAVDLNQCYVEVRPIWSTEQEKFIPYVGSHTIQAGERRKTFTLGDNVTKIVLLNYNRNFSTGAAVNNVTVSSKNYDDSFTYRDLLIGKWNNRSLLPFDGTNFNTDSAIEYDQSFILIENMDLDSVAVDIQFNSTYVTANNNVLVCYSYYTDMKTLVEAEAKTQKVLQEKLATLKQNQDNAKL